MKALLFLFACALALTPVAADTITIHKVTITGPSGSFTGKLMASGDELIFVDDNNPEASFKIPKSDITTAANQSGTVRIDMSKPLAGYGKTVSIVLPDADSAGKVVTFVAPAGKDTHVKVETTRTTTHTTVTGEASRLPTTYLFDVSHKHAEDSSCKGKLVVDGDRMSFESLTEPSHSHTWNYNQVQKFSWMKQYGQIIVEPSEGGKHDFKVLGGHKMDDAAYKIIGDRIAAARMSR